MPDDETSEADGFNAGQRFGDGETSIELRLLHDYLAFSFGRVTDTPNEFLSPQLVISGNGCAFAAAREP